jgi:hypothetical protein
VLSKQDRLEAMRRFKHKKTKAHERLRYHALLLVTDGYSFQQTAAVPSCLCSTANPARSVHSIARSTIWQAIVKLASVITFKERCSFVCMHMLHSSNLQNVLCKFTDALKSLRAHARGLVGRCSSLARHKVSLYRTPRPGRPVGSMAMPDRCIENDD